MSVLVYVVAWLAFRSTCESTFTSVAFGVNRLPVSVFVSMLVAVRAATTVAVDDVKTSVAIAEAFA